MTTLQDLGENEIISRITAGLSYGPGVIVGPGDDTAVVRLEGTNDLLLTSDPVVEGIHFTPSDSAPAIGRKAVARALSDVAAMGGEPDWMLINIVAPPDIAATVIEDLYKGASDIASEYGAAIVGGDVSEGQALELHVFAAGRVPTGKAILRSGAKPGDIFYVTGTLGGSMSGKHLQFTPRLKEGKALRDWASSMIDISDGIATDLPRMTSASHIGARIFAESIPVSDTVRSSKDLSPLDHALGDGEDFELLFTIPADREAEFLDHWRARSLEKCTRIGEALVQDAGISIVDNHGNPAHVRTSGYEHFKN